MTAPGASSAGKTEQDLEWLRLCAAVVARCRGPRGARPELPLAESPDATRVALAETAEAFELLLRGEPLPLDGQRDVREHLARVDRQGALDGPQLRDLIVVLGAARVLRKFLAARREVAPHLVAACAIDPTLDRLEEELAANIESDGTLADHASPELRKLRTETANLRARLVARLEEMIHKHADVLSDRFYTIRDGRYVLPLRTDAHERIEGIVHGASSSGATVFVEPHSIVVPGNRLKMALAEQEREEVRLLAVLSDLVRERHSELVAAVDALEHADLCGAMARFGRDVGARVLPLADGPRMDLRRARHPLLALEGVRVVPNDIVLRGEQALVISGPNAGGKTVALKLAGLTALMMRAGLPVLADEGSECGFFDPVLTDVGDDQSLAKNLSTFSAHVTNLAGILQKAGPRSLVLLDELAGGTDPEEGAALACAVVDALCKAGAAIAVTTHYEPLKAMATRDPRLRNASVGFDVERMEPTFTLTLDVPGASSALNVARRFGIPSSVIEYAQRVLPEQSRTFDELVRRLEAQRGELVRERAQAEAERERMEALRREYEERVARVEAQEREKVGREAEKLVEQVRRARDEVRTTRRSLREAKAEAELEEARKRVESAAQVAEEAKSAIEKPELVDEGPVPSDLRVGDRVFVPRLRRDVDVIEAPSKGRVRVAAGAMKLWMDLADVRAPAPRAAEKPVTPLATKQVSPAPSVSTADNTLDVRGLRVDDAVALVETFLDRMFGASEHVAFIVHGVGQGALRDAVRELLGRSPQYVKSFRAGTPDEGGPRLTVVSLK